MSGNPLSYSDPRGLDNPSMGPYSVTYYPGWNPGAKEEGLNQVITPVDFLPIPIRLIKGMMGSVTKNGACVAVKGARGLSPHGGTFSSAVNSAGGENWTSVGKISQTDFATYVNAGLYKGEVSIISGVHGTAAGETIADISLYKADLARFGNTPGVNVYNFAEMTSMQITDLLRGSGTTIGGFRDSGACLAPFK